MLLVGAAVFIVYEAYLRLEASADTQPTGMLLIAIVGSVVNALAMKVLMGGKDESVTPPVGDCCVVCSYGTKNARPSRPDGCCAN